MAEYRRHFEYKLADGYSEEETAARLGDPAELAAQFEPGEAQETRRAGGFGRSALTWTGLVFADIFVLSFFTVFACWVLTVACTAVAAALIASLAALVAFAAAAMVTSMLTAGALEYWHVWGWFV